MTIVAPKKQLIKPYLEKYERVEKLIKVLVELDERFDCSQDAHNHIYYCLRIIEKQYGPAGSTMTMFDLNGFHLCKRADIHFSRMMAHSILIGINGAYAIYKSIYEMFATSTFDWIWYRDNSQMLVECTSLKNESLWYVVQS